MLQVLLFARFDHRGGLPYLAPQVLIDNSSDTIDVVDAD
jgi:hypothetical protein